MPARLAILSAGADSCLEMLLAGLLLEGSSFLWLGPAVAVLEGVTVFFVLDSGAPKVFSAGSNILETTIMRR